MIITMADVDNYQGSEFKIHRVNGRPDYLFVHFRSPAMVMVNGTYTKVDKGSCIFFGKHKIQSYFPCKTHTFLHDYIHFDLESNLEEMLFSDIPIGIPITLSFPELITSTLFAIKNELNSSFSNYKKEVLTALGSMFIYRIKNETDYCARNNKKRANFKALHDLRQEIYRNPQKSWSIDHMCKTVCMSRSYFQHLYKEFFDISCTEDVIQARISAAKALLLCSNFRVSEIAEKCGYQNTTHFIRQFKGVVGVTPEKFRFE